MSDESITEMNEIELPSTAEMYQALCDRNSEYEGIFFVGVRTTGIFCRPTCPARKPKLENVDFFRTVADCLAAGFRACKRCTPLEPAGETPAWLSELLSKIDAEPNCRWTDAELRAEQVDPARVRRWFKKHHGMTFHAFLRSKRLAGAMGQISTGNDNLTGAALSSGYESLSGFREAFKNWFGQSPAKSKSANPPILMNRILTQLGPMVVAANEEAIVLLEFADRRMLETQLKRVQKHFETVFTPGSNALIEQCESEMHAYLDGTLQEFTVPIASPGSEFQETVWKRLKKIPYGKTTSYDRIARDIKRPGASRAVGTANGDNRLAIIIPCHRVIRSDGSISGYGGGKWRKKWLLDHEQRTLF